jgi:5S rRNA maturation endonuclease (ribonuclease M5)
VSIADLPDLQSLARALGGEVSGGQVLAPGPGHSASDRSLSVKLDAGAPDGFVVHSFAGDDPIQSKDYVRGKVGLPAFKPNGRRRASDDAIAQALMAAAAGQQSSAPKGRIVETYSYTDATGTLLYQVCRLDPKDFRQRRPDGKGGWIPNAGERRVPYRLPDLLKFPDATIFVCEGEKDADRVAALGHCATTVACGKWTDGCIRALAGRHVVILEDADEPGQKAAEAAKALHGTAKTIRIVRLPGHEYTAKDHGKDISDWLDADARNADKFVDVCFAVPEWTPSVVEDWLAVFAKKSNEALAARAAAEKKACPPPDERAAIDALAHMGHTEYDRVRIDVAAALGIRRGTLDDKVEARRGELKAAAPTALYPHWTVAPWPEPVDGAALLEALVVQIQCYVVMQRWQAVMVALWVMQAWVHDAAVHSPILLVTSPEPNSGKTTLLGVIEYLAPRAMLCVGLNEATLFRSVELWAPTLISDEGDTTFIDNEPLRAVYNSGWTRGAGVPRCIGDDHTPKLFKTFCPKVLGLKGKKLPDTTLSRAIIIEMKRKLPNERVEDFAHEDNETFAALRRKLARWSVDHAEALVKTMPGFPAGFHNRVRANSWLMLAIAEAAGGDWPATARTAAEEAEAVITAASAAIELLAAIKAVFEEDGGEAITSAALVGKLTADPESRWHEWKGAGKPLTQKQLAGLLRPFGVTSETLHPVGQKDAKGYKRERFKEVWERYLSPFSSFEASKGPDADETCTSSNFQSVQKQSQDGSKNANLSYSHAGLDAWTDRKPEDGEKADFIGPKAPHTGSRWERTGRPPLRPLRGVRRNSPI